jgi:predicted MFS family arabinose efflux permease
MGAGQNMTRVVGPSIAGIVIALFGVGPTFLVQAAILVVAFFLVLGVTLPPRAPRVAGNRGALQGMRLVFSRPEIRGLFLLAAVPMFFVFPYIWFLNVFAKDIFHIGAGGLGSMMAVSGMGAVVGSLGIASARRIEGMGRWLVSMSLIYGFVVLGVTFSRSLFITYPLLFRGSLLGSAVMSGNTVLVQHAIDDDVRGRVMGAYMLTWGLMPLGALPMGVAANRIGTPQAIAVGALISTFLVAVVAISSPALRRL